MSVASELGAFDRISRIRGKAPESVNWGNTRGSDIVTPIIERSEALTLLNAAADTVCQQMAGKVALVSGELGIGKTHLINEFLTGLPDDRVRGRATCDHFYNPRSLGLWLDLAELLGKTFTQSIGQALEGADPIGQAGHDILQLPPGTVIVLEDIHDADLQSLDLLRFVVRRLADAPILLVCTYRPEEVGLDHPLVSLFGDLSPSISIRFELPPLTREEVADLCAKGSLSPEPVYRLSGGNPHFVNEIVRKSYQQGQPLPEFFKQLAATRLQRLTLEQRAWIELLALVPPPHKPGLPDWLAKTFDLDPRQIPAMSGLLANSPGGVFSREVMRLAVMEMIPAFTRTAQRRKLLSALQDADPSVCEAESWFKLAYEVGDELAVAQGAIAAARAAEARGDLHDCVMHLAAALPIAREVDADLHREILELWVCRSAVTSGLSDSTISLIAKNLAHWTDRGNRNAAGSANLLLAKLLSYRAERVAAIRCANEAIQMFEQTAASQERAAAYLLLAELSLTGGDLQAAARQLFEAKSAFPDTGADAVRLEIELVEAKLIASGGRALEAMTRLERCHADASARALTELAVRIQIAGSEIALGQFDVERAKGWAERTSPLISNHLTNCWKTALTGQQALVAVHAGRLTEAAALSAKALHGIEPPPMFAFSALLAGAIASSRKGEAGAIEALDRCMVMADDLGMHSNRLLSMLAQVEGYFLRGMIGKASERIAHLGSVLDEAAGPSVVSLSALWMHRLGLGEPNRVGPLFGAVERELVGEAGAAMLAWKEAGYLFQASMTRLFASGPSTQADYLQAVQEFQAMDARGGISLAMRMADERGIRLPGSGRKRGPYRAARNHPLGLTRREVDILRMMVDGEGNREIALRLGRSLRTIEHHVSAILGKMGIESRVQAVLYAVAHPDILEG